MSLTKFDCSGFLGFPHIRIKFAYEPNSNYEFKILRETQSNHGGPCV